MIEYGVARKEQLPGILDLYRQLVPGEEPLNANDADMIWDKSAQQGVIYFAAADGDKIISSLYLAIIPNLTRGGRSNGFIENVITHEEYRGKGIGKKLMRMAVEYGKANGCYKVVLLSGIKRKEAHAFYQKCGFDGDSKRGYEIRFTE